MVIFVCMCGHGTSTRVNFAPRINWKSSICPVNIVGLYLLSVASASLCRPVSCSLFFLSSYNFTHLISSVVALVHIVRFAVQCLNRVTFTHLCNYFFNWQLFVLVYIFFILLLHTRGINIGLACFPIVFFENKYV